MWKKVALLVAVASAVTQAARYWNEAGAKTAAQRKRQAKHDVQRWEDEGGNLPPSSPARNGADAPHAAGTSPARSRTRAGSGSAGQAGRGSSDSASG